MATIAANASVTIAMQVKKNNTVRVLARRT
jgi:hypothetical protein